MTDAAWLDAGPDDLQPNVPVTRKVGSEMVMLVRTSAGVTATAALCPHKFANLADGTFVNGCVTCPQHEATFDLLTGESPEGSWAGRLAVYTVRQLEGRIQVQLA